MTDTGQVCHYLEAAPADIEGTCKWSSGLAYDDNISGTETAIGTGRKNTTLILSVDINAPAARACMVGYNAGGTKTDWFLPSRDELDQLYKKRVFIDDLHATYFYWSSTQGINNFAEMWNFENGILYLDKKDSMYFVRAIRAF